MGAACLVAVPTMNCVLPAVPAASATAMMVGVARAQTIEQDLRDGTVGMLRSARWLYRHTVATLQRAMRTWRHWLAKAGLFSVVAMLASVVGKSLWRTRGWRSLASDLALASVVYALTFFDRRADRLGRLALIGALLYGVAPWDLIPDRGMVGVIEDGIIVGAASRWFTSRTSSEVVERHARAVTAWKARTRSIRARRRHVRDSAKAV